MLPTELKKRTKTPDQALASLMRLCARAEKSSADALRLMRTWGLGEQECQAVLAKLLRDRFIDDTRYAAAFVRDKLRLSGWGVYKIRTALQRKGIPRETIDSALRQADGADMTERLHTQLIRKARIIRSSSPYELKAKLIRYGLSLGYAYEAVIEAAADLVKETDQCEEF